MVTPSLSSSVSRGKIVAAQTALSSVLGRRIFQVHERQW